MNNNEPAQAPCDMGGAGHRENMLFRKIVESRSDLVYFCSADHRVVYMNPPLIERTGRDVTGEICYKALHGKESACPVCASSIIQPDKSHCWELASPEDGRIYYVSNVPIIDEDGTTAKASIMYDISECRRIEENLRGEKKLSEGVIKSLPGILFLLNADLQLICCNRNLEEIAGYSTAELAGMHSLGFFAGSEKEIIAEKFREVLECGKTALEANLLTKTGDMIPHSLRCSMDFNV